MIELIKCNVLIPRVDTRELTTFNLVENYQKHGDKRLNISFFTNMRIRVLQIWNSKVKL